MSKIALNLTRIVASLLLINLTALSAHGQDAKKLYEQTCAMCHGTSGKGDGPTSQMLQPKPANLAVVIKEKDDAYLTKLLKGGGASVGKSPFMPSYQGTLSDAQIQSVIQYVRGFSAQ